MILIFADFKGFTQYYDKGITVQWYYFLLILRPLHTNITMVSQYSGTKVIEIMAVHMQNNL